MNSTYHPERRSLGVRLGRRDDWMPAAETSRGLPVATRRLFDQQRGGRSGAYVHPTHIAGIPEIQPKNHS